MPNQFENIIINLFILLYRTVPVAFILRSFNFISNSKDVDWMRILDVQMRIFSFLTSCGYGSDADIEYADTDIDKYIRTGLYLSE